MVYTHYWAYRPDSPSFAAVFPQLVDDARLILERLAAHGVALAGPTGIGEPLLNTSMIAVNGVRPNTGENLILAPGIGSGLAERTPAGEKFRLDYCQTRHLPYDLAVIAILLRANQLAPWDVALSSDGSWADDWSPARGLLGDLFGVSALTNALVPLEHLRSGPFAVQDAALAHA